MPGHWEWHGAGTVIINGTPAYRDAGYGWVAGYWARVQPGYVWVAAHYRWTPSGFIYIPGYWDLAVSRRGFLYAPVYMNVALVGPGLRLHAGVRRAAGGGHRRLVGAAVLLPLLFRGLLRNRLCGLRLRELRGLQPALL